MATLSLENYYTKSQLSERHGRHTRTLGKDITGAVARRDQELLALLRLQVTPGGQVLDGPKVTTAKVKQLKTKHTLTWFARDEFVELVIQKKPQRRAGESSAPKQEPAPTAKPPSRRAEPTERTTPSEVEYIIAALPEGSEEKARMLEQLYRQATAELVQARAISADFKEVFRDFKEVVNKQADGQQQNNKLLNDLIQEVREPGMLGTATEEATSSAQGREVVEAVTVAEPPSEQEAATVATEAKNRVSEELASDKDSATPKIDATTTSWHPDSLVSRWLPTIAKGIDRFTTPTR